MSQEDAPASEVVAPGPASESDNHTPPAAASSSSSARTDPPPRTRGDPPAGKNPAEEEEEESKKREELAETATDATAESSDNKPIMDGGSSNPNIVVSSSRKSRPPYKYDPNKITLRFLFANKDGLTVTVECKPSDTVGEVKGALISVWPDDVPDCDSGENLRLICMGKGFLTPDSRTLEDCQIPVFKTHPTPINVSVKPNSKHSEGIVDHFKKKGLVTTPGAGTDSSGSAITNETSQGCGCVIQ